MSNFDSDSAKGFFLRFAESIYPHFESMMKDILNHAVANESDDRKPAAREDKTDEDDPEFLLPQSSVASAVSPSPPHRQRRRQPSRRVNNPKLDENTEVFTLPWNDAPTIDLTDTTTSGAQRKNQFESPVAKRQKRSSSPALEDDDFLLFHPLDPLEQAQPSGPPTAPTQPSTGPSWSVAKPTRDDTLWFKHRFNNNLCLVIEATELTHVIEYNELGQLYVVDQLTNNTHYQKRVSDFHGTAFLPTRYRATKNKPILFYPNDVHHCNEFVCVVNQSATHPCRELTDIIKAVDFSRIKKMLADPSPINGTATNRNENKTNITFGFTSQNYTVDDNGIPMPDLIKGTDDDYVKHLFQCGSTILDWPIISDDFRYCPEPDRDPFLSQIGDNVSHEGMTISTGLLREHEDTSNPSPEDGAIANVLGLSYYLNDVRYNIGWFNKKCICDAIRRADFFKTMCGKLVNFYNAIPACRRPIQAESPLIRDSYARILPYPLPGTGMSQFFSLPCNVDPMGYYGLYLESFIYLKSEVNLTFIDTAGLVSMCYELSPNTALFLSMAVDSFESPPRTSQVNYNSVPVIRFVMNEMKMHKEHYDNYCRQTDVPMGVYRFSARNNHRQTNVKVPNAYSVYELAQFRALICLYTWKLYPDAPPGRKVHSVYSVIHKLFRASKLSGAGDLCIRHEMAMMSFLGLLPAWIRTFAPLDGRVLQQVKKIFPYPHTQNPSVIWHIHRQRSTLDTIGRNLSISIGSDFDCAKVENLLCKYTRSQGFEDGSPAYMVSGSFVDVHRHGQLLVKARKEHIVVYNCPSEHTECPDGVIFNHWVYGGRVLRPQQIAADLPDTLPERAEVSMPELSEFKRMMKDGRTDAIVHQFERNRNDVNQALHDPFFGWSEFKSQRQRR